MLTEQQKRMATKGLVEMVIKYYEDPEHEREFQEWLAERNATK